MISRAIVSILLLSFAPLGAAQVSKVMGELRARYERSFQSIYLTEVTLNNLKVHMRDEAVLKKIAGTGLSERALKAFHDFLVENEFTRLLVQIDLQTLRIGYKTSNDRGPTINLMAWDEETVAAIAVFCDKYFAAQQNLHEFQQQMMKAEIPVVVAWDRLSALAQDPFVPPTTLAEPLAAFSELAKAKKDELAVLAKVDAGKAQQISAFGRFADVASAPWSDLVAYEVPANVKTEWASKYKFLTGYWLATDNKVKQRAWKAQLDMLQQIELSHYPRDERSWAILK